MPPKSGLSRIQHSPFLTIPILSRNFHFSANSSLPKRTLNSYWSSKPQELVLCPPLAAIEHQASGGLQATGELRTSSESQASNEIPPENDHVDFDIGPSPIPKKRRRIIEHDDDSVDCTPHPAIPSSLTRTKSSTPFQSCTESDIRTLDPDQDLDSASESGSPLSRRNFVFTTSVPLMYADLCKTFDAISSTTKRLEITAILATFLQKVIITHSNDLLATVYLCINRVSPEYEGLELGIGESILMKAISESTGRSVQNIKSELTAVGDLGEVSMASRGSQATVFKPKPLNVSKVFKTLKEICAISGGSSQKLKVDKIKSLMISCRGSEAKYLVRSLEGKLRIGLAERTVISSLAHAFVQARRSRKPSEAIMKNGEEILKSVYSELPSYDEIVPILLQFPIEELASHCHLTPGVPLKPMLAHPTKSITEVLDRFDNKLFICEYKYDGERAQIHRLENNKSYIFSRNSEDLSERYPDVISRLDQICTSETQSFVLDCEAVAWDTIKECILPFQVLSTRKRKGVKEEDITIQVSIFAFDLLYLNGESLLQYPLQERRKLMLKHFVPIPGGFGFTTSLETKNLDDIQGFLDQSIQGFCEGLMVKTLCDEASYEPSKRSRNWLKVKKDYLKGMGDSLDLIVIGGYIGKGKRTGVYGGFLLACYDPDTDEYQSICKIGTGFSEEALSTLAQALEPHILQAPKSYYNLGDVKADVWFDAVQVWEVKAADLSISPVYQAAVGLVDRSRGVSLRFPRFIRVRDDKTPNTATFSEQVADMYKRQQINSAAAADD